MRAGWIVMIGLMGWAGLAEARPSDSRQAPRQTPQHLRMTDHWKSPVRPGSAKSVADQRWRLTDSLSEETAEAPAIRWKLQGAKIKLRMPLALH